MRIGISAFAGDSGKSGISQYMANAIGCLVEIAPQHEFVAFVGAEDADWVCSWHPRIEIVSYPNWIAKPSVNIVWHLARLAAALRRQRCDLVFMPAANRRLAWHYGVPSVGTVHDFSQLHVPQKYDRFRMFYIMRVLPALTRRLSRVIAVSESTRRDCETFARIPSKRIRVSYNGADLSRFKPDPSREARAAVQAYLGTQLPPDAPYLLYTSRLEHPGKNHVRLLEAFAELREARQLPHRLVLAGMRWSGAEIVDAGSPSLGSKTRSSSPDLCPTSSSQRSTAPRICSSSRRYSRDSVSQCSRPWPQVFQSVPPIALASRRSWARPDCCSTQTPRERSRKRSAVCSMTAPCASAASKQGSRVVNSLPGTAPARTCLKSLSAPIGSRLADAPNADDPSMLTDQPSLKRLPQWLLQHTAVALHSTTVPLQAV